jgi:hypothetical protein
VKVLSKTEAWAVGYAPRFNWRTLVERWNGRRWNVVPSPNVGSKQNVLSAVAVISATDAWAVGNTDVLDYQTRTLIEHWDGQRWSVVPSANMQARHSELLGVVAVAADDVWAVGGSDPGRDWQPLIEHWDGRGWSLVGGATSHGYAYGLAKVPRDHSAGADLFAMGDQDSQSKRVVLQHWDGFKWTVVPGSAFEGGVGSGVDGTSSHDLWAVGIIGPGPDVAHWNGVKWSEEEIPFRHFAPRYNKRQNSGLYGVFAITPANVWAVGFGIEHWNGKRWKLLAREKGAELSAVDGSSARDVWAVGDVVKHYSCK